MAVLPMSPFTDPKTQSAVTVNKSPVMGRAYVSSGNRRMLKYSRRYEGMPAIMRSPMAGMGGGSQGPSTPSPDRGATL